MSATDDAGEHVVELRRYTLHPGRRDELVELFERALVVPQEAAGMSVLGQFRDVDHPDTFTWLRSFPDMTSRRRALERFYGGPVWAEHRDAANATMIDSDDVHLLRCSDGSDRRQHTSLLSGDATARPRRFMVLVASLHHVDRLAIDVGAVHAALVTPGWTCVAALETLAASNDFPALPVHGTPVAVSILASDDDAGEAGAPWPEITARSVRELPDVVRDVAVMRLVPTDGSRLR